MGTDPILYVLLRYKFSVRSFAHKSLYVGVLISHLTGMSPPSLTLSAPRPGSLPAVHLSLLRVDAGAMVVEGTVEVPDDCVEGAEVGIGEVDRRAGGEGEGHTSLAMSSQYMFLNICLSHICRI